MDGKKGKQCCCNLRQATAKHQNEEDSQRWRHYQVQRWAVMAGFISINLYGMSSKPALLQKEFLYVPRGLSPGDDITPSSDDAAPT